MSQTYTVADVQNRVEEALGERPTANDVHRESGRAGQRPNARVRLMAGLPAPVNGGESVLEFDRDAVESWLAQHPRLQRASQLEALYEGLVASLDATPRQGDQLRAEAVHRARSVGLSWAQIADQISVVDGRDVTRQAVAKRYGQLRVV